MDTKESLGRKLIDTMSIEKFFLSRNNKGEGYDLQMHQNKNISARQKHSGQNTKTNHTWAETSGLQSQDNYHRQPSLSLTRALCFSRQAAVVVSLCGALGFQFPMVGIWFQLCSHIGKLFKLYLRVLIYNEKKGKIHLLCCKEK